MAQKRELQRVPRREGATELMQSVGDPEEGTIWEHVRPRKIPDEDWARYEAYVAEIFQAFGMNLETVGTLDTPHRFLLAMFDSTSGYEGDPKLLTAFPTECDGGPDCRISQVIEGPISFFSLCEHHALPFHGEEARRTVRRGSDPRAVLPDPRDRRASLPGPRPTPSHLSVHPRRAGPRVDPARGERGVEAPAVRAPEHG